MSVNLTQIYRQAGERLERRVRRWRRAAVLLFGAAAAVVAFALLPRFELRLEQHQLVLRWANPVPAETPAPPPPMVQAPPVEPPDPRPLAQLQEQMVVLSELVQGQRDEITQLQNQIVNLRQQVAADTQRWLTTERDVAALSVSPSVPPKKGELP